MKKKLLLFLWLLSCVYSHAQSLNANGPVLQLVKPDTEGPVVLTIKANKKIRLRTLEGETFTFHTYSFLGDSAIVSGDHVVLLKSIKSFKGKVKGSALRKTGGIALVSAGYYFGATGAIYGLLGALSGANPLLLLLPVPAFGVTLLGSELAGARRFDTSGKWQITVVNQPE